ncbi:MAG: isoprenyl transferase [Deltaproteobacteria bacterium]|jgi:undecaprenyl diphosphate synthase|nr:isoprenyl transferase [Deltaproteobacteria bacterium]MCL5880796.1 isoprenyl transferase [Deltaproteobacteria bacterium]MDA8304262.1 isoprenyl transferase [Deltaproteobacteria bacterium]
MIKKINFKNVPNHLAIIMDGNGRWAKKRNLDRIKGHIEGIKSLRAVTSAVMEYGIKYLTVYAFSSENWQRPKTEVSSLMFLLEEYLNMELPSLIKNKIRLNFIGNIERIPENSKKTLLRVIDKTKEFDNLHLTLALSYGSREEILTAAVRMAKDAKNGKVQIEDADENLFSSYLYTKDMPNPDFLIRTSGEKRISNFMLYQIAYAEIYFTKTLWPDFGRKELIRALKNYEKRVRRFGKT